MEEKRADSSRDEKDKKATAIQFPFFHFSTKNLITKKIWNRPHTAGVNGKSKKDFPSNELRLPIHGRTEINLEQFGPLRRRALFVLAVATMDKRRPTAAGACHCPSRQLRQSPSVSVAKEISENGVKNFYANSKEKSISTGRGAHARPSTALQLATSPPSRSAPPAATIHSPAPQPKMNFDFSSKRPWQSH